MNIHSTWGNSASSRLIAGSRDVEGGEEGGGGDSHPDSN